MDIGAKDGEYFLTYEEGQFLLMRSPGSALPEKLGDDPFDVSERAHAADCISSLRAAIRTYSPGLCTKERRPLFGELSNWERKDGEGDRWGMIDPTKTLKVKFTDDQVDGAFWISILAAHPASPVKADIGVYSDVLLPLAEKLGFLAQFREMLRLNKPGRKVARDKKADTKEEAKA